MKHTLSPGVLLGDCDHNDPPRRTCKCFWKSSNLNRDDDFDVRSFFVATVRGCGRGNFRRDRRDTSAQTRSTCEKLARAKRDAENSKPYERVWLLECKSESCRVCLVPKMAAKVERIEKQ